MEINLTTFFPYHEFINAPIPFNSHLLRVHCVLGTVVGTIVYQLFYFQEFYSSEQFAFILNYFWLYDSC